MASSPTPADHEFIPSPTGRGTYCPRCGTRWKDDPTAVKTLARARGWKGCKPHATSADHERARKKQRAEIAAKAFDRWQLVELQNLRLLNAGGSSWGLGLIDALLDALADQRERDAHDAERIPLTEDDRAKPLDWKRGFAQAALRIGAALRRGDGQT